MSTKDDLTVRWILGTLKNFGMTKWPNFHAVPEIKRQ